MFCSNCGTKVLDGAGFCQQCGADLRPEVAQGQNRKQAWQQENVNGWVISPYYRKQFEKIAMGQKPNFNWAAFFFGGWNQLYNGCTSVFCKTYLPVFILWPIYHIIAGLAGVTFNVILLALSLVLGIILSFCGFVLAITNGLKFNTWYYNDIMDTPEKKRSRKGVVILLVCVLVYILVCVIFDQTARLKAINKLLSDANMYGEDNEDGADTERLAAKQDDADTNNLVDSEDTNQLSDVADARPLYNGIPVDKIMEMSAEDVIAAFGEPSYQDDGFLEIQNEGGDSGFVLAEFDSAGRVFYLAGDAEKFELNAQNFYQDYDGLVATFGREPDYQEKFDMLELTWYYDDYSILIGLGDDGLPGKTEAWKKITMEEAEQRVNEWLANGHQMWDNGYLEYADEGILRGKGMEVYNFRLMISEGAWLPIAVEKITGMMWVVPDDGNAQTLDEYYIENFGDAEPAAAANDLPNGFIWVETPTGSIAQWTLIPTITGIVQNVSGNAYSYAQITFNLYDPSGNQVGTALATINNLKAGGTWKFEAIGAGSNVSSFEFASLDAF